MEKVDQVDYATLTDSVLLLLMVDWSSDIPTPANERVRGKKRITGESHEVT